MMEEKANNENLDFLMSIYQDAPEGAVVLNEKGTIMRANKTAIKVLKEALKQDQDIIGLNGIEFLRQNNDDEIIWPPDSKTIRHRYVNGELMEMVTHKIPNTKNYLLTAHLLDGENGIRTVMEKQLSELIANTVHDFKTPMNSIVGFTGLCLDEVSSLDPSLIGLEAQENISNIKEYLGFVLEGSHNLVSKVNNLLTAARLEQGLSELNLSEINLLEFTQTISKRFSARAQKSDIRIARKTTSCNYFVHADYDLLERALENMILNAIETIEYAEAKDVALKKEVTITFGLDDNGLASITVSNPGEISPENIKKMFKTSFTTKKNGNGLGTKTISLVAKAHKGKASVKCENGLVKVSLNFPDAKA